MPDNVATYDGRNIEDLIGFVEEDYNCVYGGVNGTLYAGKNGLAFLGKLFLFERKVYLKWVDVMVQQTDQGVALQTRDADPVVHEFMGIQKPDRVWSALVSLQNQALLDQTRSPPSTARKHLRRMTSDPNKLAPAMEALFGKDTDDSKTVDDDKPPNNNEPISPPRASFLQSKADDLTVITGALGLGDVSPLSEIEAIVGKVQGEFSCLYNGQRGKLYAGSIAIYFAGERLFFPARLTLKSSNILQVKMIKAKPRLQDQPSQKPTENAILKEQGIVIWTTEGIPHTFLGMVSPDQVWASLVGMRNHTSTGPNTPRPFSMRRMNSDPNLQSKVDWMLPLATEGTSPVTTTDSEGSTVQKQLATPVLTDKEWQQAWSDLTEKKNRYKISVVMDHEFGCTLDRFFKLYISDDAEFNIGKCMQNRQGDKDVKTSPWKQSEQDGKLVQKRVIHYVHPVNAPMAPPQAAARKEQTYRRYGDFGFSVDTNTFVVGVPMADCFFVKDRLLVAAAPTKGNVLVSMEFELEFIKSTMFRGVITSTTNSQVTTFCQQMRDYMIECLGDEAAQPKVEPHVEKEIAAEESGFPSSLIMPHVTHILLVVIVLMQLWILLEMQTMKQTIQRVSRVEYQPVYSTGNDEF